MRGGEIIFNGIFQCFNNCYQQEKPKKQKMNMKRESQVEMEMQDDYFQIIRNFRKVEKSNRRKLLKIYKLRVAAERKKQNLKASQRRTENRSQSSSKLLDQSNIWDVLNDDCLDFKLTEDCLFKDQSFWILSEKTEETLSESHKHNEKKGLFLNEFVQFSFSMH